ncbi:MAG TPA: cytochrome b/b6 domain-containing protein [Burkholderiales bacterium]
MGTPDSSNQPHGAAQVSARVWDLPVRLFHWTLVALLAFQLFSGKTGGNWMQWHGYAGYTILALVLFRILWGFAGSTTARFSSFLAGPARAVEFLRRLVRREPVAHASHNPLGGWMVVVLLAALLVQAGTGLFANDDIATEGPLARHISKDLSDRLTTIHYWNLNFILALVAAHVAAVLFHWRVLKENLIGAMFTGDKLLPADLAREVAAARTASSWRALALVAVAAAAVYVIVKPVV